MLELQAILMSSVLCENVTIFGMASPGTTEKQEVSSAHDLDKERLFLKKVVRSREQERSGRSLRGQA